MIESFDEMLTQERYRDALSLLESVPPEEIATNWRLRYRQAWAGLTSRNLTIPEALMVFEDLAASVDAASYEAARPLSWIVRCYTAMRLEDKAQVAAENALAAFPYSGHVMSSIAYMHLAFDDRPEARSWLERAVGVDPDFHHSKIAYADLMFIVGKFTDALDLLADVSGPPDIEAAAAMLRAAIFDAVGDSAAEVAAITSAMDLVPQSDMNDQRRLLRAGAHAANGDYPAARKDLIAVWHTAHDEQLRSYARRRLDHLAAAGEDAVRIQLAAFPSVHQKWDYCGPAVLELCLQYNGIELTQDEIADVVKRTHGTPMYEIVSYLETHGIESRRIEATPNALRAAIDEGLPVIVQEEYSNSSHVAVIIGYDGRLGTLIAADPATHARISKAFEFTSSSGDLFGNGGILILGRSGTEKTAANQLAADAAGLRDQEHLRFVDDADKRQRDVSGEEGSTHPARIIELCDEALAISPNFKLAHARRAAATLELHSTSSDERTVGEAIRLIRTRFPDERFSHHLHAGWLMNRGRYAEALIEYDAVRGLDENDAGAAARMALIHGINGDNPAAEHSNLEALRSAPTLTFAWENLAGLYVGEIGRRAAIGDIDHSMADEVLENLLPSDASEVGLEHHDAQVLRRRADLFSDLAVAAAPTNPYNHETAGILALVANDPHAALDYFGKALAIDPSRYRAQVGLAAAEELEGLFLESEASWLRVLDYAWGYPKAYLAAAAALGRMGNNEAGLDLLIRGVSVCHDDNRTLIDATYQRAAAIHGSTEAVAIVTELCAGQGPDFLTTVADALDRRGRSAASLRLRRQAIVDFPESVNSKYDLARRLGLSSRFRTEAEQMFSEMLLLDHSHHGLRQELARLYAKHDVPRAIATLEPMVDDNIAYARAVTALLQARNGSKDLDNRISLEVRRWESDIAGYRDLIDYFLWFEAADAATIADLVPAGLIGADAKLERHWMAAMRLSGRGSEVIARIGAGSEITSENAFEVFWAANGIDDGVAAIAADIMATGDLEVERPEWLVRAATVHARRGDMRAYEDAELMCGRSATAWALCAADLVSLGRRDKAREAIDRAIALDPDISIVLAEAETVATACGELDDSWLYSQRLWEQHPLEHQGAERLAFLHALVGDEAEARTHSDLAIADGAYCHVAWSARSASLLVNGDTQGAASAAHRSLALHPIDPRLPNLAELVQLAVTRRAEELAARIEMLESKVDPAPYARFTEVLRSTAFKRGRLDRFRRER